MIHLTLDHLFGTRNYKIGFLTEKISSYKLFMGIIFITVFPSAYVTTVIFNHLKWNCLETHFWNRFFLRNQFLARTHWSKSSSFRSRAFGLQRSRKKSQDDLRIFFFVWPIFGSFEVNIEILLRKWFILWIFWESRFRVQYWEFSRFSISEFARPVTIGS